MFIRRVVGNSMLPALKPGSIVFAVSVKKYKSGDIVIVSVDNKELIKRVVSINNELYEVAGDNLLESTDSRHFGMLNISQIKGKVFRLY